MRVLLLGLLWLLWLFSGCAHTFIIEKGAPPQRYVEADEFLHDNPATVKLHAGSTLHATDVFIGPDSTVFRIDGATDRIVVMNDRIRSIATQDVRKGIKDGALIGGITGSVLGLIIGGMIAAIDPDYVEETGPESQPYGHFQDKENDAVVIIQSVAAGAIIGGTFGGLIGSQSGTMHSVEFYKDPKDPRRWEYLPR